MTDLFDVAETLKTYGQEHLLAGIDALDDATRDAYMTRLAAVNWQELAHPAEEIPNEAVGPSRVITFAEREARAEELGTAGEAVYAAGQVAVLMVAGGQGTRLGFDGPKGCFEVGVHSGKSIYQIQAEKVLAVSKRTGKQVPFLVMTSPMTDTDTRDYFTVNENFGLADGQVRFFSQGTVPSLNEAGQALLAEPGRLLENPDGHGGCFQALVSSGELQYLRQQGIKSLVYIQVDNILVPVDDPELVGLAAVEKADVITKVLEKAHPDEKVGHLVRVGDQDRIIEYTELTPEETRLRDADGELLYRWGSPAMHCWSVDFLGRLEDENYTLPLHRSKKPLKAWQDGAQTTVTGWKSERFIFDLVPQATISLGLQIDRRDEFAPVKNAEGADSPASAQQIASDAYARWLQKAGVQVELPESAAIEISPCFAATETQLLTTWDNRCASVTGDFYLEA